MTGTSNSHVAAVGALFVLLMAARVQAGVVASPDSEVTSQMKALYAHFIQSAAADADLRSGLMRAGFHDCITAHKGDPQSGCNGSLRKETTITNNANLADTVKFVEDSVRSVAPLISHADAFLLGMAASTFVSGGGSIVLDIVDPGIPRTDYAGDDTMGPNRTLGLPNPFTFDFNTLLTFYKDHGMDARDLVISVVVGHSLGALDTNPFEINTGPALDFTPRSDAIGQLYAGHLTWLSQNGGTNARDASGFNTLPSDRALITDRTGLGLLSVYTSQKPDRRSGSGVQVLNGLFGGKRGNIGGDFRIFAIKLSKQSGAIVGRGPINVNSQTSGKLVMSTKGWDDQFLRLTPGGPDRKVILAAGNFPAGRSQWYTATEAQKTAFFTNNGGRGAVQA